MGGTMYGIGRRHEWCAGSSRDGAGRPRQADLFPFLLIDWAAWSVQAVIERADAASRLLRVDRGPAGVQYRPVHPDRVLLPLPTLATSSDLQKLLRLMGVPQIVDQIITSLGRDGVERWPFEPEHTDRPAGSQTVVGMGPRDFALLWCLGDEAGDIAFVEGSPQLRGEFTDRARDLCGESGELLDSGAAGPPQAWRDFTAEHGCVLPLGDGCGETYLMEVSTAAGVLLARAEVMESAGWSWS